MPAPGGDSHLVQALQKQSNLLVEVAVKMKGRRNVRNRILREQTLFSYVSSLQSLATTVGLKTPSLGFAVPALEPLITSPSSNSNRTRCLRLPLSLSSLSLSGALPCWCRNVVWGLGVGSEGEEPSKEQKQVAAAAQAAAQAEAEQLHE